MHLRQRLYSIPFFVVLLHSLVLAASSAGIVSTAGATEDMHHTSLGYDISSYDGPLEPMIEALFPTSTAIGDYDPENKIWPIYKLNRLMGYAFESIELAELPGFAGKPINMLVGLDLDGNITGIRILQHAEPIFLHGLGPEPLIDFVAQYTGQSIANRFLFGDPGIGGQHLDGTVYLDGITKATVSVVVMNDVVLSSAMLVAREKIDAFARKVASVPDYDRYEEKTWEQLLQEDLVHYWQVSREDVEEAMGNPLDLYPEMRDGLCDECPKTIETWVAYLNVPTIGRALLGEADYQRLRAETKQGEHVIGVMSRGFYAIPRAGFRNGTVPERISIEQAGITIPIRNMSFWRDSPWQRPASIDEDLSLLLFKIRPQAGFNPAEPWGVGIYFNLARNHLVRDSGSLTSTQQLPEWLFVTQSVEDSNHRSGPLWLTIWQGRQLEIGALLAGLGFITFLFLKQSLFIRPGARLKRWRYAVLIFTTVFVGYYTQGQLSVVNIYTLLLELFDDFDITVFLLDPVLFILWAFTFLSLFLFGRGLFCGWLCPFGALQEFAADLGKRLRIPQISIPTRVDQPLRYLKYVILLVLVGLSTVSLSSAEVLAEVEPFKTAITLHFMRSWPFVLYAVGLLVASMVVHKFYCRYVCPLGAGLAILGAFPLFKWLHRRAECGKPCQFCRHKCEIGAIDRYGHIDYQECVQCLECVRIIEDPNECAPERLARKRASRQMTTSEISPVRIIEPTP